MGDGLRTWLCGAWMQIWTNTANTIWKDVMNVMNIVRTRVSMPSEATLLFCHGWKWAYQVCGLPVRISCGLQAHFWCVPSLEQGGGKFPNWGLFSITFGCLLLMMLRMIFKRGLSGNFSPCHGCCQSPFFLILFEVFSKNWSCVHFKPIWDDPTVYSHKFSGSKATTQLLPPGDPAWPRCFSLLGSSGLHEPPPSQRLVLAMFWRDSPGFH